jgi:hypothetical protein
MSQRLTKLKALVKTANELDDMGLHKEADAIDQRIVKISQVGQNAQVQNALTMAQDARWTGPKDAASLLKSALAGAVRNRARAMAEDARNRYLAQQTALTMAENARNRGLALQNARTMAENARNMAGREALYNLTEIERKNRDARIMADAPVKFDMSDVYSQDLTGSELWEPIRMGDPKYIFIPGDRTHAYKYPSSDGSIGTYEVYDIATGQRKGKFRDQAGLQKVMAVVAARDAASSQREMGTKQEGDLASVVSSFERKLHKRSRH